MTPTLWPPLGVIRAALDTAATPAATRRDLPEGATVPPPSGAAALESSDAQLLLPLTELARRREALAQRAFGSRWSPGRLVGILHEGRLLGVLLDQASPDGLWRGWLAAGEPDWAGPFDVLLEPGDEPFEPLFGVIQAWNRVALRQAPQYSARVLGELSATRLAAIRAVADEAAAQVVPAIDPAPGRIALRGVAGVFDVLAGTPLGRDDPRADYQGLYLEVASRLSGALSAAPSRPAEPRGPDPGPAWPRLRRWLGGEGLLRPALVALALVVVVQNAMLLRDASPEDEVRFRSVPAVPAVPDLRVRFKPGVEMQAAARALQALSAEVVGGPDAQGTWRVRGAGREALAASPLVESVESSP